MLRRHRIFAGIGMIVIVLAAAVGVVAMVSDETKTIGSLSPSAATAKAGVTSDGLSAFSRPRTAADELPAGIAASLESGSKTQPVGVSEELYEGAWKIDESRLLLDGLGSSGAKLYAVATQKGRVCFVLTPGGATCNAGPEDQSPVMWGLQADNKGPVAVAGLIPDAVSGVTVIAGEARAPAVTGSNGFFYEFGEGSSYPVRLVLSYHDGSTKTVELMSTAPPP